MPKKSDGDFVASMHLKLFDMGMPAEDTVRLIALAFLGCKKTPGRAAGGFARARSMTSEERSACARNAANSRWKKNAPDS